MDGLVRQLAETNAPAARVEIARRIDALVATEAPVIPLITPEWYVGLSNRLAGYEPWGSDYSIVRSDTGLVA
jgi:peptide/nickel transport system substrate-binding protein